MYPTSRHPTPDFGPAPDRCAGADHSPDSGRFFGGNLVAANYYMERHWGQNRLDKSSFTRRLHARTDTPHALFALVGDWLRHRHSEGRYVLGSFPMAVCHKMRQKHLGRIPRCKLLKGKAYHGRCASKRNWFYGLKVQVVKPATAFPSSFIFMVERLLDWLARQLIAFQATKTAG